ncbi:MAG: hypothetical protein K2I48_03845, partial [Muribaculaceae bacterium]|nr:hypothetical protein [Muribaculaceae bacterium]
MRKITLLLIAFAAACTAHGAPTPDPKPAGKTVSGQRKYKLIVSEGNDSTVAEFNRGLESMRGNMTNRGFLSNLMSLYKTTAAGQAVS